jgi:hypothetical protein
MSIDGRTPRVGPCTNGAVFLGLASTSKLPSFIA